MWFRRSLLIPRSVDIAHTNPPVALTTKPGSRGIPLDSCLDIYRLTGIQSPPRIIITPQAVVTTTTTARTIRDIVAIIVLVVVIIQQTSIFQRSTSSKSPLDTTATTTTHRPTLVTITPTITIPPELWVTAPIQRVPSRMIRSIRVVILSLCLIRFSWIDVRPLSSVLSA